MNVGSSMYSLSSWVLPGLCRNKRTERICWISPTNLFSGGGQGEVDLGCGVTEDGTIVPFANLGPWSFICCEHESHHLSDLPSRPLKPYPVQETLQ